MKKYFPIFGFSSFNLGIFFLPSALPIGGFFLIISMTISFLMNGNNFFKDKLNYPLCFASLLMIISNLKNTLFLNYDVLPTFKNKASELINTKYILENNWIDLLNWLPFFLFFWSSQKYLTSHKQREIVAKTLIIGTIPVIYSCIRQYFFNSYGPFKTLFGLIVWFQVPQERFEGSVTGLFSNPNYCGFWLAITFPFIFYFFKLIKRKIYKIFLFLLFAADIYFLIMTNSRNALISIFLALKFIISAKYFLFLSLISICIFTSIILYSIIFNQTFLYSISSIFSLKNFKELNDLARIEVWLKSLKLIYLKPIFGWGAAIFPFAYLFLDGKWNAQHSHNIIFQLAFNYGLPVSLILGSFVVFVFYKTYKKIFINSSFRNKSTLNKFWFASGIIFLIYNLTDITYYDGKISLIIWILLSGMRSILNEETLPKEGEITF